MRTNLGIYCASRGHFQFMVLEYFKIECFMISQSRRENLSLLIAGCAKRSHCQFLAGAVTCLTHVWVILWDPKAGPKGVVLWLFDFLYVLICIVTIHIQFHLHTIPQNSTTKCYDTQVQLRLTFESFGRLTSKLYKT